MLKFASLVCKRLSLNLRVFEAGDKIRQSPDEIASIITAEPLTAAVRAIFPLLLALYNPAWPFLASLSWPKWEPLRKCIKQH